MCGRVQQTTPPEEIAERFGAATESAAALRGAGWRARWNLAPSQPLLAIRAEAGDGGDPAPSAARPRVLVALRWGLVPRWAKDPKIGHRLVNARAESAAEKPAFRDALRRRRCLVPVDGFYEWTSTGGPRAPWSVTSPAGDLLAIAALWERWRDPAAPAAPPLETCVLLTTGASASVRPVHDRMPVIVAPEDWARWLDPAERDPAQLANVMAPGERTVLALRRVGPHVNDPRHDDPDCLHPV